MSSTYTEIHDIHLQDGVVGMTDTILRARQHTHTVPRSHPYHKGINIDRVLGAWE